MRNYADKLLQEVFDALDGSITYGGDPVPVFTSVGMAKDEPYYVLIDSTEGGDWGPVDRFGFDGSLTLQVVTKFDDGYSSRKPVENIADQVYNLLAPEVNSVIDLSPTFSMTVWELENSYIDVSLVQTEKAVRCIIRFHYYIEEVIGAKQLSLLLSQAFTTAATSTGAVSLSVAFAQAFVTSAIQTGAWELSTSLSQSFTTTATASGGTSLSLGLVQSFTTTADGTRGIPLSAALSQSFTTTATSTGLHELSMSASQAFTTTATATGAFALSMAASQSYTTTATATVGSSLLIDTYTGAALAYSFRRLATAITDVARVRETGGNTEQDFSETEINDGTLTTFTGSNDGATTKMYQQADSPVYGDMIQSSSSAQPLIVSAGSLNTVNSKGAAKFNGSSQYLIDDSVGGVANLTGKDFTMYVVFRSQSTVGNNGVLNEVRNIQDSARTVVYSDTRTSSFLLSNDGLDGTARLSNFSSQQPTSTNRQFTLVKDGSNFYAYAEGVLIDSHTPVALTGTDTFFEIGRQKVGLVYFGGHFCEVLIYPTVHSPATRAAIEANQISYWGV